MFMILQNASWTLSSRSKIFLLLIVFNRPSNWDFVICLSRLTILILFKIFYMWFWRAYTDIWVTQISWLREKLFTLSLSAWMRFTCLASTCFISSSCDTRRSVSCYKKAYNIDATISFSVVLRRLKVLNFGYKNTSLNCIVLVVDPGEDEWTNFALRVGTTGIDSWRRRGHFFTKIPNMISFWGCSKHK